MAEVALLVETALGSGREILRGVSQYVHERNDWHVFHYTGVLGAMVPSVLEHWEGDGIIARVNDPEMLEVIRDKNVPVVDVLGNVNEPDFAVVKNDNLAISELVFSHFEERGFRSFAFLGLEGEHWSKEREKGFREKVESIQCSYNVLLISHHMKQQNTWTDYLKLMSDWLKKLPKPTAVFVCSDQFAPDVTAACKSAGFRIPEEVAIVGVDNDAAFCEVVRPSLSSVDANHLQVGYQAAALLNQMIEGETDIESNARVAPFGVVTRQSSDSYASDDPQLKKALDIIQEQACNGINVDEIARQSGFSRSVLQRRFQMHLGRTVHDFLLNTKLNRARELLVLTRLSQAEVAVRSGFNHQEYLSNVFKKKLGCTPGEYRRRFST